MRSAPLADAWRQLADGGIASARELFAAYNTPQQPHLIRGEALFGLGKCELAATEPAGDAARAIALLKEASPLLAGSGATGAVETALAEAYLRQRFYELAREHMERGYHFLDGTERVRAAALVAILYEHEGFDALAANWRERAGPFADGAEFTEMRAAILPPAPPRPAVAELPAAPPAGKSAPQQSALVASKPSGARIVMRKEWGAGPPRRKQLEPMGPIKLITIHHTADEQPLVAHSLRDVYDYLRRLQSFHQNGNHWADIGYHYLIDAQGRIFEGRPLAYQGAHAGSGDLNEGNIGVALIGDFDRTRPTAQQLASMKKLVDQLLKSHRLPHGKVTAHSALREKAGLGHTDCPGRYMMPHFRRMFAP